jgi:DinB superfamily
VPPTQGNVPTSSTPRVVRGVSQRTHRVVGTSAHPRTGRRTLSIPEAETAGRIEGVVDFERCDECGFNGEEWSDAAAISAIEVLPTRFASAVAGLNSDDLFRRPVDGQWSIAEYADHVREVLFGMRFLLDVAVTQPGTDLGESPSSPFEPESRRIDIDAAMVGIEREVTTLVTTFSELSPNEWRSIVTLDGADIDAHWIVRHAVHDSTHHLLDLERLRLAL